MNKIKTPLIYHNPLLKDYLNNLSDNLAFKKTLESYTEERYKASDIKQTLSYRTINSGILLVCLLHFLIEIANGENIV
jgi:hypothetical protein